MHIYSIAICENLKKSTKTLAFCETILYNIIIARLGKLKSAVLNNLREVHYEDFFG